MDPLAPLTASLHNEGRLRVWSLVITVFGDLVQHRGGEISSTRLGQVLGRVGVEGGAVRTALSRLTRDGWVTRQRSGRSSLYQLSQQGLARFAPATSRIYAPPRVTPVELWALSLTLADNGEPKVVLLPADRVQTTGDCQVVGTLTQLSEGFKTAALPPEAVAALGTLSRDLCVLEERSVGGIDAAAARLLLIHRWRRIVLRYPEPEPDLMPLSLNLANPRQRVAEVYAGLSAATEAWLGQPVGDDPALPVADATFATRFTATSEA